MSEEATVVRDSDFLLGSSKMNLTFSSPCPLLPLSSHLPAISTSVKKFKKVVGKETYSETLESTPSLEKEKFPQDYFPEVGHLRSLLE